MMHYLSIQFVMSAPLQNKNTLKKAEEIAQSFKSLGQTLASLRKHQQQQLSDFFEGKQSEQAVGKNLHFQHQRWVRQRKKSLLRRAATLSLFRKRVRLASSPMIDRLTPGFFCLSFQPFARLFQRKTILMLLRELCFFKNKCTTRRYYSDQVSSLLEAKVRLLFAQLPLYTADCGAAAAAALVSWSYRIFATKLKRFQRKNHEKETQAKARKESQRNPKTRREFWNAMDFGQEAFSIGKVLQCYEFALFRSSVSSIAFQLFIWRSKLQQS